MGYYVGPKTTEVMLEETHDHAKKILDAGCKLLTLGGDHTIPYGMVRAASENMADSRFCILIHIRTVRQVPMEMCPMLILHTICRRRAVVDPKPFRPGIYPNGNDGMRLSYFLRSGGCIYGYGNAGGENKGSYKGICRSIFTLTLMR